MEKRVIIGLDGNFVKELKLAITDINEDIKEKHNTTDFHIQQYAKNIYLFLIGNYDKTTYKWLESYRHYFIAWREINDICDEAINNYRKIENRKNMSSKI